LLAQLHGPHEDFSSWREATPPSVQHRRPSHHLDARSDAPTRAATADSAPPSRPLRHLFGILSRPVLDCVLLCSASEHLRFLFWLLQKPHASGVSPCTKLVLNEDRDILLERAAGVPTRHPDRESVPSFPFWLRTSHESSLHDTAERSVDDNPRPRSKLHGQRIAAPVEHRLDGTCH